MIVPCHVTEMLRRVRQKFASPADAGRIAPRADGYTPLRPVKSATPDTVAGFRDRLGKRQGRARLADARTLADAPLYARNIENLIGTVKVPLGLAGPLRVNGVNASGDYMVPPPTARSARAPGMSGATYVGGNFSGDKKASSLGTMTGRGRKVSASVGLPAEVVRATLHTTPGAMLDYARVANPGALLSGQMGAQAHQANGLAALYIATGQDAACVAESAVGFTRMEPRGEDLSCSVTRPNILAGPGHGAALAEVAAALCLCGEISIVAAMAAGHFTRARQSLARGRRA